MDEFLALMEDGGGSAMPQDNDDDCFFMPCESPASTSQSDTTANTTGSLTIEHARSGDRKKSSSSKPMDHAPTMIMKSSSQTSSSKVATVGVDDKLGIRMMNRLVSSLDLLDLITTTSPYYSPAQIAAMSLQGLCRLLMDPPPSIIDPATVQGRTSLVTVGIVFENSGTKTSSKGGAFCILKIGSNLQTGPCLPIFLFGSAYTKFCRSCQAGQVVAICNPKLLPARMDDKSRQDTSVSLSVHDQSQLIHVAKARDYGICQGKTRGKTDDGSWSDSARNCKHYIDKRMGDFCAFHSRQQQEQQLQQQQQNRLANCSQMRGMGGVASNGHQGAKMIQQYKAQKLQQPMQGRNNSTAHNQNRFLGSGLMTSRAKVGTSSIAPSTHPAKPFSQPNRFLEKSSTIKTSLASTTITSNPYLAKTAMSVNGSSEDKQSAGVPGIVSAIPMHMKKPDPKLIRKDQPNNNPSNRDIQASRNKTADWMMDATSKRKTASHSLAKYIPGTDRQRTRKISTVGGGFDGSVVVPKPSQLFSKNARIMSDRLPSLETTRVEDDTTADRIKEQQALLAAKLREGKSGSIGLDEASNNSGTRSSQVNPFTAKKSCSTGNSFLDSIHIENVEAVLAAKSQFASEADAEDYVKNRSRVVELEKLETQQDKRKASSQQKENQKIICEWVCRTCPNAPRFAKRPTQCISSGHKVKRDRMLKQGKTKDEERAQLNEKAPENGGIVLGRGLEWSFNRFNQ